MSRHVGTLGKEKGLRWSGHRKAQLTLGQKPARSVSCSPDRDKACLWKIIAVRQCCKDSRAQICRRLSV